MMWILVLIIIIVNNLRSRLLRRRPRCLLFLPISDPSYHRLLVGKEGRIPDPYHICQRRENRDEEYLCFLYNIYYALIIICANNCFICMDDVFPYSLFYETTISAIHAPPLAHSSSLSVIIIRLVILKQITLTCFAVLLCGKLIEKKNSQYLLLLNLYLFYYE